MSDYTPKEAEVLPTKRTIKLTPKGLCFYIEMSQEKRSAKFKQAKMSVEKITVLMESNENVNSVNLELANLIQCCQDAKVLHESLINLPLPQDEIKRQCEYFEAKMIRLNNFIETVKHWLSELGHPYVYQNVESPEDQGGTDEINPDDSASNVSSVKANSMKPHSQLSQTSSSASARIKAQAEKAALMQRVAALKRKHQIEAKEENLRREKEQLELETELAATSAKLNVLEMNSSVCGSKRSDGMTSYFERNISQGANVLNLDADMFVPVTLDKKHATDVPVIPQPPVVRPKQSRETRRDERFLDAGESVQFASAVDQNQAGLVHPRYHAHTNGSQDEIVNIMQRQNDIAALLVQQNLSSALPSRNIPVFDGDPLHYRSFIKAFENGVEEKTSNWSDRLHFLEQYTSGEPRNLVHSCQHMPSEMGYNKAKLLLAEHFGNEHKIASSYMERILNWTPVKGEDVKALQSFSLFLRGCSNLTEQMTQMKELDLPFNMRSIIMKLPYKLRERWRNVAYDLLEKNGRRALFVDLVTFIEKQVKIASDPLFGNIQDSPPTKSKSSKTSHFIQRKKESSFATNVTTIKEGDMAQCIGNKIKPSSIPSCLFCLQTNHLLDNCSKFRMKLHRDKINFIKEKGICFGCLKVGHMSKDCRSHLECNVCNQKHPRILHIERQDKGTSSKQSQQTVSSVCFNCNDTDLWSYWGRC